MNLAFTKHITNALIEVREERLKCEFSIPRKLGDAWEPTIKMKVNDFECSALCDLGSSISIMPKKKFYDVLDLGPLEDCDLNVNFLDATSHTHLGKIDDVIIMVNGNYVPVDLLIMDLEFNLPCPTILGRPFFRTVGAIIDMRVGNIKFHSH